MRTIEITEIDLIEDWTKIVEWGVNNEFEGLFFRREDGTWKQVRGTGQFRAKTPREMMRKIRRDFTIDGCYEMRMVRGSAWNWDCD